jgi:hypothetical protein
MADGSSMATTQCEAQASSTMILHGNTPRGNGRPGQGDEESADDERVP